MELYPEPLFRLAGDRGLLMELGEEISPKIQEQIRAMLLALEETTLPGVVEFLPGYRSLAVVYDPLCTSANLLRAELLRIYQSLAGFALPPPRLVEIPVCYGGELGPDLGFVARHNQLTEQEVVSLHSGSDYLVYMIGFTPGFPYLGGLDQRLHTPRLASPRKKVPAGSVGIANGQTGVYPIDSPGGWQLIGRTPLQLFDPGREKPFLLAAGDTLRFVAIDYPRYQELSADRVPTEKQP
ncbi:MAG: 5-oxoprolinase subunit PxpB [Desulforhopalus sp.]|jgi:KipI family sensor histidine kinase inhibitor|nr:5-oxoprolinase subunit PxpB [Desulforhopalus sp.]